MADGSTDANALLLSISADNSKLIKSLDQVTKKLQGLPSEWGTHGKKAAAELEKSTGSFTGEGFSKALGKVFDSSKLAVLEEGSAKLRIFGSALEPLGPLGIAAAAGVAAFGVALEEAHKAVEFADELYKLAKNAHVTTDELQQMQFALRVSGGNAADASGALQSFSATLGKAQAGLPKAQKAFLELGFTKDQIKGFADAGTALDAVVEKISGLKSNAQKDAVIEQLGLQNMKPLIEEGAEKMREFKAEAMASGNVMDSFLVKRGHELNEEIETATGKIKVQLAEAFVNIGPVLVKLLGYLAQMAEYAEHVSAALSPIEARGTTDLQRELRGLQARQAQGGLAAAFYKSADQANIPRIQAELAKRAKEPAEKPPAGTATLTDVSHHATPADQTANFDKSAQDAYDTGLKALIEAQKALTADIQERADAEKAAVQADLDKKLTDLTAEEAKIRASKNDAHKAEQIALIEKAKTEEQNAAAAKTELIDRDADFAVRKQLDDATIELNDMMNRQLAAQASIAPTAEKRADLELQIFKYQQDTARLQYQYNLALDVATKRITQAESDDRLATFDKTQAAELASKRYQEALSADPVLKYLDSLRDVSTFMKSEAVTALDGVAGGLADIVANGAKAGDVLRNLVRQLLYDWTKMIVQQGESSLLGKIGIKLPDPTKDVKTGSVIVEAFTAGGNTAATAMGTAITTAGAEVAAQLAAAMAAGGAGGSAVGGIGSILSMFSGAGGYDLSSSTGFSIAAGSLPMFADGTDGAPGGLSLVGERGPELMNIPRGAQIIPNDVLRGLSRARGQSSSQSYAPTLNLHVYPPPGMSGADARRTGSQVGAAAMQKMAKARRAGY